MTLAAIVLCGGKSTRMGSPKAWLDFEGEPLLARVVRRLAGAASPIVVVAAAEQALPPLPEYVEIVRDSTPGRGPVEGLRAGLAAVADRAEAAFVTSTDAPWVEPAFALRLEALRREAGADAAAARVEGRVHPLSAVYAARALVVVEELVRLDRLRLTDVLERLGALVVGPERLLEDAALAAADPGLRTLVNVNTRAELEAAASVQ